MWLYLGPSCPDHPSFEELSEAEVNSQVHKVLDFGVDLNPGADPAPLQEGVASARFSMLGPISVAYVILSFHHAHSLAQCLKGGCGEMRDTNPPEDAVRREVEHASNEKVWAQRERTSPERRPLGDKGAGGVHLAGGNRSYPDLWAIIDDPRYLRYKTPTQLL
jgi:hypothetical protein